MAQLLGKECGIHFVLLWAKQCQVVTADQIGGRVIDDCRNPNVVWGLGVFRDEDITNLKSEASDLRLCPVARMKSVLAVM